jgi:sulfide dehydrogenase [flavocytochrome c] flavoprotein subunit
MNRRSFNTLLVGSAALSLAACSGVSGFRTTADKKRVVVVGGGFGGATAAKYIKKFSPLTEVVLIEQNQEYFTCPFGNAVIGGLKDIEYIRHTYDKLQSKYGVIVIHEKVKKVDGANHQVILETGEKISYTKAVVSPGIDFKYEKGYVEGSELHSPHAYKAGAQTTLLKNQLQGMKKGGTYVMVAPPNPFRCPPGPYERISLVAHYLKNNNPTAKIIILDQKKKFSKQGLFQQGWNELYGDMIEWRSVEEGGKVVAVDPVKKLLTVDYDGDKESVQADVLNYIPAQKAGQLAFDSGLTKGDWCPVNTMTFESRLVQGVYVIGDASVAKYMPKSGFSANSQAKIAALQIARALKNLSIVTPPKLANTCYSLIGPNYGISVAAVYEAHADTIVNLKKTHKSGGLSPMKADASFRLLEAQYAEGWYQNQMADIFS